MSPWLAQFLPRAARTPADIVRVELFGIEQRDPMRAALDLRRAVFCDEQGVPLEEELDEHDRSDRDAVHALAYEGSVVLGTGRFYESSPGCAQIGRMAVALPSRGRGVGSAILEALMMEAQRRGFERAALLAQVHAIPFYERHGYVVAGDPVLDGGIFHRPMERGLGEPPKKVSR
jgi:predicted GNAT family N-acyltransferase